MFVNNNLKNSVGMSINKKFSQGLFSESKDTQPKILIVEDCPMNQKAIFNLFKELGYQVIMCANGEEALAVYQDNSDKFELILTDLNMPVMDGYTFASHLRKEKCALPIMAITSDHESVETHAKCSENGINRVFPKPHTRGDCLEILSAASRIRCFDLFRDHHFFDTNQSEDSHTVQQLVLN